MQFLSARRSRCTKTRYASKKKRTSKHLSRSRFVAVLRLLSSPHSLSAVTLTTVGYGDLSAHKPATKLFACVYILVGVAMIAAFLAQLVELLLDEQASVRPQWRGDRGDVRVP